MITFLILVNILAFLAIPVVLTKKFRRTRDRGLLMLGVALVVWPVAAELLTQIIELQTYGLAMGKTVVYPFSLFAQSSRPLGDFITMLRLLGRLVSSALIVVGLSMLYQSGKFARPV